MQDAGTQTAAQPQRFPHPYDPELVKSTMDNVKVQHRPQMKLEDWDQKGYVKLHPIAAKAQTQWLENLDTLHNGRASPYVTSDVTPALKAVKNKGSDNAEAEAPNRNDINNVPSHIGFLKVVKSIDRYDFNELSPEEFRTKYEYPSEPVMIMNATDNWESKGWTLADLGKSEWAKDKFRLGDDEDQSAMRVPFDMYLQYLDTTQDDSPLYAFEDDFVERYPGMAKLYSPPKYFSEDLFLLTPIDRRPPFRWIIAGSERCGTKLHIDPLGTSAWNALNSGCKRWVIFSPATPFHIASGSYFYTPEEKAMGRTYEAIEYFTIIIPRIRSWMASLPEEERKKYDMREFLQKSGELLFVPNSFPHAVVNHNSEAVAFTQNWASAHFDNFKVVWSYLCNRRRHLARRLFDRLEVFFPDLAKQVDGLANTPENVDNVLEPQRDKNMKPRRLARYSIEERIQTLPPIMEQVKSLFPDYFEVREGETEAEAELRHNRAIDVMLQGNEDSSDSDSDSDDSDDSDEDEESTE